jgi:hypothetical protein
MVHIQPRQLANILIVPLGQLAQMAAKHLLLIGDVTNNVRNGLLVGHLAGESGGDFIPNVLVQLPLLSQLLIRSHSREGMQNVT